MRGPAILISKEDAFQSIKAYCLAKTNVVEDYPWGDVAWKVGGKMFACGGDGQNTVTVKSTPDQQSVLIQHPSIERAAYVGRYGWVTISVTDQETLEMAEDLIDQSYDLIASKSGIPVKR